MRPAPHGLRGRLVRRRRASFRPRRRHRRHDRRGRRRSAVEREQRDAVAAPPGIGLPQRRPLHLTHRRASGTAGPPPPCRRSAGIRRPPQPCPPSRVHSPAIGFESENEDQTISVQVALQWNTWSPGEFRSFANNTRTHEGGAHEEGFRTALTSVVNEYARRRRQMSADDQDLTAEAVQEGMTVVISVKLAHPVFEGSTRTRLSNPEANTYVQEVVRRHLTDWLDHHPNQATATFHHIVHASTGRRKW
ncbi:hypothetical protein [Streptomyces sp. NPDC091278]|uniref:hypothetical protein n=1 Tax=Streptomyces sp. NPDC091278 TaxID=3155301 RepID=UPI00344DFDD0